MERKDTGIIERIIVISELAEDYILVIFNFFNSVLFDQSSRNPQIL